MSRHDASKSARKREMQEIASLVDELVSLPEEKLNAYPVPASILEEIRLARSIKPFTAIRRQKRYITRLLSEIDLTPIRTLQEQQRLQQHKEIKIFHQAESWRARLLSEPHAVDEFIRAYPNADTERLRHVIDQARHASINDKRAKRSLFRQIQSTLEAAQQAPMK